VIAVDTNVLLRYLLWDDERQALKADRLMNGPAAVLITDVVLAETLWTLKGKKYGLPKPALIGVALALFAEPNVRFEDGPTVWTALHDYRQAKPIKVGRKKRAADFPDALLVHKARYCAMTRGEPCDAIDTFDAAARKLPGTKAP
jgi:predicted nucleic-acid-binding protein